MITLLIHLKGNLWNYFGSCDPAESGATSVCLSGFGTNRKRNKNDNKSMMVEIIFQLFSVIAFGCISSKAWQFEPEKDKEVCIMNDSSTACQLGNGVAIIAFLASIGQFLTEQTQFTDFSIGYF